jgi:acetoin utilization protein AcuB
MPAATGARMPSIGDHMTRQPLTIRRDAILTEAHALMRQHRIRHLPVLDEGRLVGIVTQHDLHLIETLPDSDPDEVLVEDAMTEHVFVASPDDDLADVVEQMGQHKYGSVVVTSPAGIEGIFTMVDAMQVLAQLLRRGVA